MRILMISKACVVGIYQRKLEEIACLPGIDLQVVVPESWRDPAGEIRLEKAHTEGYQMAVAPLRFNGYFHLHYFPTLPRLLRDFRPDIVHIDEEPYNLACWHALRLARRAGARSLFFSWQNIRRTYPPPFAWGEAWTLKHVDHAIAGTDSAAEVWRAKGYAGPITVVPQFGIDPQYFQPVSHPAGDPFTIGFAGRLVPEKGVDLLLRALADLPGVWRARILGGGPERDALCAQAAAMNLADRVEFIDPVPSTQMASFYHGLDAIVLPSRTRPNWKEQFGRVIIEAMACGVPVIGADSAAIPGVTGDAGLLFPEGDISALRDRLRQVMESPDLRADLAARGRVRVLENFTHERIARQTVAVYHAMMQARPA
ncbi:MAG TPA: glycosyltransferase [Aggregatilineales bacterium]|nr:glycosyltransferase [Aggregatilineales bacterium]